MRDGIYNQINLHIKRNNFSFDEKEESTCKRLDVRNGKYKCVVKVYKTGTIQIQEAESKLLTVMNQAKRAIENKENIGKILPFEIERFHELLKENAPGTDPIIAKFIK